MGTSLQNAPLNLPAMLRCSKARRIRSKGKSSNSFHLSQPFAKCISSVPFNFRLFWQICQFLANLVIFCKFGKFGKFWSNFKGLLQANFAALAKLLFWANLGKFGDFFGQIEAFLVNFGKFGNSGKIRHFLQFLAILANLAIFDKFENFADLAQILRGFRMQIWKFCKLFLFCRFWAI